MNDKDGLAQKIAAIWASILNQDVSTSDNILLLGASSLQVLQFRSELQRTVGKRLSFRDIYTEPLPEAMALALGHPVDAPRETVPLERGRNDLASPAQAYFFEEAAQSPHEPYLYVTLAVNLDGEVDVARLQASFQRVAGVHEALRTYFIRGSAGVIRRIADQIQISLLDLDCDGRHDSIEQFLTSEIQRCISLSDPPLYRIYLTPASTTGRLLVFLVPHITMDGFSLALWLREVMMAYASIEEPVGATRPAQESEFIAWQSTQLTATARAELRQRFSEMIAGLPPSRSLSRRVGESPPRTMNGWTRVAVNPALSFAVDSWAAQHHTSLYSVLVAAWNLVFFQHNRTTDTVIRASGSIRDQTEFSRTIGMLWAPLFIRCRFSPEQTLEELVRIASDAVELSQSLQYLPPLEIDNIVRTAWDSALPMARFYFTLHNDRIKDAFAQVGLRAQVKSLKLPDHGADGADMKVHFHVGERGIGGSIMYSETLFDQVFIEQLFEDFVAALNLITTANGLTIADCVTSRHAGRC